MSVNFFAYGSPIVPALLKNFLSSTEILLHRNQKCVLASIYLSLYCLVLASICRFKSLAKFWKFSVIISLSTS